MLSPIDEAGNPVDWFFAYKVPELSGGAGVDVATGYEYVYYDATIDASALPKVQRSEHKLDQGSGAINATLAKLWNDPDAHWIVYNDEHWDPDKSDDNNLGHTKGVLGFNLKTGNAFWLLHSWPKFPDKDANKPPTPIYGQTFMCLSLSVDNLKSLAEMMIDHHEPQVCAFSLPGDLPETDPLHRLCQAFPAKPRPSFAVLELETLGGMPFKVMAKNRQWNDDFWNDGVGPELGVDLKVETWIRGAVPPVADKDGLHKIADVKFVNLSAMGAHWAWSETQDHAKWAISADPTKPYVCIGDINRMISQRKRGGGCIAFENQVLWTGLLQADVVLAAPGKSLHETHKHIQGTHVRK